MKEKLKNSLTISEKDKKLLVYVFAFLIIFIAYFVGYQNLSASLDTSTKQVTELTKKKRKIYRKRMITKLSMSQIHFLYRAIHQRF